MAKKFILDQEDRGITGGDPRGLGSIDLQTIRTSASQVAGGTGSAILGGACNTASHAYSFVIGCGLASNADNTVFVNSLSATSSILMPGLAAGLAVCAGTGGSLQSYVDNAGLYEVSSGSDSTARRGVGNAAMGAFSAALAGQGNCAAGDYSFVVGGGSNRILLGDGGSRYNSISGGCGNVITGRSDCGGSLIGGGYGNTIDARFGLDVISGGFRNCISYNNNGFFNFIGSGCCNRIT